MRWKIQLSHLSDVNRCFSLKRCWSLLGDRAIPITVGLSNHLYHCMVDERFRSLLGCRAIPIAGWLSSDSDRCRAMSIAAMLHNSCTIKCVTCIERLRSLHRAISIAEHTPWAMSIAGYTCWAMTIAEHTSWAMAIAGNTVEASSIAEHASWAIPIVE